MNDIYFCPSARCLRAFVAFDIDFAEFGNRQLVGHYHNERADLKQERRLLQLGVALGEAVVLGFDRKLRVYFDITINSVQIWQGCFRIKAWSVGNKSISLQTGVISLVSRH